ncbi:cation:proton antiporter [candidate division NPL-UPA2 bacterium]|nr:cation:proton antiporter [candidate division NPL-UPA2 bacterium]
MWQIFAIALLSCCSLCLYRIGRGPTPADRMVAIDILGIMGIGFCALFALSTGKEFFMNIALTWALLSFIGTLALAKYLGGKGLDE